VKGLIRRHAKVRRLVRVGGLPPQPLKGHRFDQVHHQGFGRQGAIRRMAVAKGFRDTLRLVWALIHRSTAAAGPSFSQDFISVCEGFEWLRPAKEDDRGDAEGLDCSGRSASRSAPR